MLKFLKLTALLVLFLTFSAVIFAQRKTRKTPPKKTPPVVKTTNPAKSETPEENNSVKKNERPADDQMPPADPKDPQKANLNQRANERPAQAKRTFEPDFIYEFSQPDFVVSKIIIKHDENGKGEISFMKRDFAELVTDPIQLSAATMEKLKTDLATVNYFSDGINYQYEKDYSHLGNVNLQVKKDGQTHSTKFNYTTDKNAKSVADEYRRIGQQFIWNFDINLARENQSLETPGLMDTLDSYIVRNEISDPAQMIPFLKELSNDERLPLIARNHATRLIQKIEKIKR